jgi:hypothetical protein
MLFICLIRDKHGDDSIPFKIIRRISSSPSSSYVAVQSIVYLRLLKGLLQVCSVLFLSINICLYTVPPSAFFFLGRRLSRLQRI